MIGREPDLTLIIDVNPEVALARGLARNSGEDRFEDFGLPVPTKIARGFSCTCVATSATVPHYRWKSHSRGDFY
jgi:hypothetical protein